MNIALWIIAGVLTLAFAGAGLTKLTQSREQHLAKGWAWVEDFALNQVKAIGALQLLGSIGLILPPAINVMPVLAAWAAAGLAVVMTGAVVVHLRRGEAKMTPAALVLTLLSLFVAWGRFGPYSF